MPELTITSPYVHSRVDSDTFIMGNLMPKSTLTLCQSRLSPPVRDFGFGLRMFISTPKIAAVKLFFVYQQLCLSIEKPKFSAGILFFP
jgi:hypothetical protein